MGYWCGNCFRSLGNDQEKLSVYEGTRYKSQVTSPVGQTFLSVNPYYFLSVLFNITLVCLVQYHPLNDHKQGKSVQKCNTALTQGEFEVKEL